MKAAQLPLEVLVRSGTSGYTTATINGQRASSTSCAETAVGRLAAKLFGDAATLHLVATEIASQPVGPGSSRWRIERAA